MLAGAPLGTARGVGVLVHGRDQGPDVMLDVAERLGLGDAVAYVLPVAAGRSWYPGRYYEPVADNEPHVTWSLECFEAAIEVARSGGLPLERVVAAGFSQGACLVAELVARRPRRFAGVAVLTGTLLGPDGSEVRPGRVDGLPMFFGSGRYDEWIRLERAESTARAFQRAGAEVVFETYEDPEHHVTAQAVSGVRKLFERALARD
ncbi:MAG: dienelactone hydrolase family protein [Solirubrobacterales bacterium]|nr:dienelactone hydrolase family protein [Solirubrobacterales bacterium]